MPQGEFHEPSRRSHGCHTSTPSHLSRSPGRRAKGERQRRERLKVQEWRQAEQSGRFALCGRIDFEAGNADRMELKVVFSKSITVRTLSRCSEEKSI
jgi:hypothetical protein